MMSYCEGCAEHYLLSHLCGEITSPHKLEKWMEEFTQALNSPVYTLPAQYHLKYPQG